MNAPQPDRFQYSPGLGGGSQPLPRPCCRVRQFEEAQRAVVSAADGAWEVASLPAVVNFFELFVDSADSFFGAVFLWKS